MSESHTEMLACQFLKMAWEICYATQKDRLRPMLWLQEKVPSYLQVFFYEENKHHHPLFLFFLRLVICLAPVPCAPPRPSSSLISLSFSVAVPHCQPIPAYLRPKSGCAWLILLIRDWMPAVHKGGGGVGWGRAGGWKTERNEENEKEKE